MEGEDMQVGNLPPNMDVEMIEVNPQVLFRDIQAQVFGLIFAGDDIVAAELDYIENQMNSANIDIPIPNDHPFRAIIAYYRNRIPVGEPMDLAQDEGFNPELFNPELVMYNFPDQLAELLPAPNTRPNPLQIELGRLANLHGRVVQIATGTIEQARYRNREAVLGAGRECVAILENANVCRQNINRLLMANNRLPLIINQVDVVISYIKKYINFMHSLLLFIDGYSGAIIHAVSCSDYIVPQPFPQQANIPSTGNVWAFLRDTTVRNYIQQLSLNRREEANTLNRYFNSSLNQEQSLRLTDFNGTGGFNRSYSLGRYGIVVNSIRFIPGQDIVRAHTANAQNPYRMSPHLAEAYAETPPQQRIPPHRGNIPIGGLYFNCRMVDLQIRNPNSPNNLPAGYLLTPIQVAPGHGSFPFSTRNLPSTTMIQNLHVSIHGSSHHNQAHIRFTLGQGVEINTTLYFMLVPFQNNNGELVERIALTDINRHSITEISDHIATQIINRYLVSYGVLILPPEVIPPPPLPANAIDRAIITNPQLANEHKQYIRSAFYHFLFGLENYLSDIRNLDPVKPLNNTRIMVSLKNSYQSDVDYKKYLKYKSKYLKLKELMNKLN